MATSTELDVVIVRIGDRRGVWLNPATEATPELFETIRRKIGERFLVPYSPEDPIVPQRYPRKIYKPTQEQWDHVIGLVVCEMAVRARL
jgi:hypothetical protein